MPDRTRNSLLRIVDAATNRATEGLRVAEDIARFHIEDRYLTEALKSLRHRLVQSVEKLLPNDAIKLRNTLGDIGCDIDTESEYVRTHPSGVDQTIAPQSSSSWQAVLLPNLKRAQQALRTIEEVSKLPVVAIADGDSPTGLAKSFERYRYETYTLEKAIRLRLETANFSKPSIYVLLDGDDWGAVCASEFSGELDVEAWPQRLLQSRFAQRLEALIFSKVDFIQIRDKQLTDRQLIAAGKLAMKLRHESTTKIIINDRVDIALIVGADGVHVGQDELSVAETRSLAGTDLIIGLSTHSVAQARHAELVGADYIGIGPVFPSNTKTFEQYIGCELVGEVISDVSLPAFAIGGINLDNVRQVADAGCSRIAVSGIFSKISPYDRNTFLTTVSSLKEELAIAE